MANIETNLESLDLLPSALLDTIFTKLDVPSICSVACTCRTFHSRASHVLSFLPNFHLLDIAPSPELLSPLMPPNPSMRCLKLDCGRLDESAIELLARPSLEELCLYDCANFTGKLLAEIGGRCKDVKSLHLGSVAKRRGRRTVCLSDLKELLSGCSQLEELILMFDLSMSLFIRDDFALLWTLASEKITTLEIGYIHSGMVMDLVNLYVKPHLLPNHIQPSKLPRIQKLCLSVEFITDTLLGTISQGLTSLTHLDLQDAPRAERPVAFDLTNSGLRQINPHGKLKHLSLVRSHKYLTYFRHVNDDGLLSMADRCSSMESLSLDGFCLVTNNGFKRLLHLCSNLCKLNVSHGNQLTHLGFHDISATTSLSLTHVCLRWCDLLINHAVADLALNQNLEVLDLAGCRNLGDEALPAIATLSKLERLFLDGCDITGVGLSHLKGVISSLVLLSLRGCKRLTDGSIMTLFDGSSELKLQELDLSNIPNLSDDVALSLAKLRVPVLELRIRQCPLIGDASVMALASMQVDEGSFNGSPLRLLDLYNCGGITELSFEWLKKPYFPRLRWLGLARSVNRDMVDALARNRPLLQVVCTGKELRADQRCKTVNEDIHGVMEIDEFVNWMDVDDGSDED